MLSEIVKALANPRRATVLDLLCEEAASVSQIASAIDQPSREIAYHVSVLKELGCLSLVDRRLSGGTIEHFYIATPIISSELHRSMQAPFRSFHDFLEGL